MKRTSKVIAVTLSAALAVGAYFSLDSIAEARPHRGGGFAHMGKLKKAMKKLDLRADQRVAVESLAKDMKAKAAPIRKLRQQAIKELAAGVRAGKIDKARAQQLMAQAKSQAEALKPEFQTALNKLHSILDAKQRAQLVDLLKKKRGEKFSKMRGMGGKHRGKMQKMAKELGLTDAQKDQIQDVMYAQFKKNRGEMRAKRGEMRAKWGQRKADMKAAAEAFKSDSFDARSLAAFQHRPGFAKQKGQRMIAFSEAVLPILTAEQREKLATMIEKRASRKAGARARR